ncbi:MAG: M48 family metallopeptidase [Paludibacteraceae bacterium]|nr:M48 family metallopeptidase [Paludibacteraceae bacterium]
MIFRDLEIEVLRKRVRNMRLSVKPDGSIVLVVPMLLPEPMAIAFVEKQYAWMLRTREKMIERAEKQQKMHYRTGESHLLWGKPLTLRVEEERGRESVDFRDDEIILYAHPERSDAERKKILYQGYLRQLRPVLTELIDKWTMRTGNHLNEVQLRLMRTEWGSCSPKQHRMTFNVDLARMPRECVEYVVIHEFTHFEHCDHSAAFWALCDLRLADEGLQNGKQQRARMRKLVRCGGD